MNTSLMQNDAVAQAKSTLSRLHAAVGRTSTLSLSGALVPRVVLAKLVSRLKGLKLLPCPELETHLVAIGNGIDKEALYTVPYIGARVTVELYGILEISERIETLLANKQSATDNRWYLPIGRLHPLSVEVWIYTDDENRVRVEYVDGETRTPFNGTLGDWCKTISPTPPTTSSVLPVHPTDSPAMEARGESTYVNIKAVYDEYCKSVTFDRRWGKLTLTTIRAFEGRDEEHINFLGGNLVGVYRLHWRADDATEWYERLRIDDVRSLKQDFHDLPTINPDFHVVGNPINASFLYAVHRVLTSDLPERERTEVAVAILAHMHYQFLSSLLYHQFPYRAQEAIALALYDSLSRKSMLKQYHTWGNLVRARSEDIISKGSIHYQTLIDFSDDEKIIYAISDIQSRIREVVKKLKSEYMRLRDQDARVMSQGSTLVTREGETVLREFENKAAGLQRALKDIILDPHDLIRNEVLESTLKMVTTADERYLRTALLYLSDAMGGKERASVEALVDALVIFIQGYLRRAPSSERTLIHVVMKVRNLMRSSQLAASDAIALRSLTADLIEKALEKRNATVQASTRIAVLVYLTIRLLTLNHFK